VNAAEKVAKKGIVVQHGMQRRSSPGWQQAMDWVKEGHIGKVTLFRAASISRARKSIGEVAAPVQAADGHIKGMFPAHGRQAAGRRCRFQALVADRAAWQPMQRGSSSTTTGTGSGLSATATSATRGRIRPTWPAGRWAIRTLLPKRVMSLGGRWGYDDDGETANNQLAFHDYQPAPLIFDNWRPALAGHGLGSRSRLTGETADGRLARRQCHPLRRR